MADDDPWADLFAKAANNHDEAPAANVITKQDDIFVLKDGKTSAKKRKKRKRSRQEQSSQNIASFSMLEQRMSTEVHFNGQLTPPWSLYGKHICSPSSTDTSCEQFQEQLPSTNNDNDNHKCKHCDEHSTHHRLSINSEYCSQSSHPNTYWIAQAYCLVRNIRCTSKMAITPFTKQQHASNNKSTISLLTKCLKVHVREFASASFGNRVVTEERNILEHKISDMLASANTLLQSLKGRSAGSVTQQENAVLTIIACDALYFRLYYLQLAGTIINEVNNKTPILIPHPVQYFGSVIDIHQSIWDKDEFFKKIDFKNRNNLPTIFKDLESSSGFLDISPSDSKTYHHPLAVLHKLRTLETISIFAATGWMSHPHMERETMRSLENNKTNIHDDPLSVHDTPAPSILSKWRDSCRDFLCNLYCYATIPPSSIGILKVALLRQQQESGSSSSSADVTTATASTIPNIRILEMGAGTGYLSRVLTESGMDVEPWDIHPTNERNAVNEYHGFTPPYMQVRRCSKFPLTDASDVSLLLCYPPPQSSMAFDCLQDYMKAGGKCLIHIGEFFGLTGNTQFEQLLTKNFICQERLPCLPWGTDASDLTIWIRKSKGSKPDSLLLPCSFCKKRQSKKRFRLIRSVRYCSNACFEEDRPNLQMHAALQMIHIKKMNFFDFNHKTSHFLDLS